MPDATKKDKPSEGILFAAAELRQALLAVKEALARRDAAKAAYDQAVVAQLLGPAVAAQMFRRAPR